MQHRPSSSIIQAAQELNREAGTSNEALQAAISAAGEDGGHFQQFELRLTSGVLFVHFNRVKLPKSELMKH